ncbi:MAG: hypothetical protein HUU01_05615 [Saprospiraceae bacterium]|nr:hypothetical protein [Saprospiraceae bacterium]
MDVENFINNILTLISKNDLKTAIDELGQFLKRSPKLDELILQSARFNDVTQQIRMGTIDFEDAAIAKNKIRNAILDLVREIETGNESNYEVKKGIGNLDGFNSKIIIKQIHAGKGDNVGRDKNINKKK